jgi:metal-sulfur cluster biosynthetic enzyme
MTSATAQHWSIGEPAESGIKSRLEGVVDPCSTASVLPMNIVQLGLIRDVTLDRGVLSVFLRLTSPSCMMVAYIAREVTERLGTMTGVSEVSVIPDEGLEWEPSMIDERVAAERSRRLVLLGMPVQP